MHALKILSKGHAAVQEVPIPTLRPGYVLAKTVAVALNPSDWKHIDFLDSAGATCGVDFAGVVCDPNGVPGVSVGDHIAGFVHGGNRRLPEDGAFGEYVLVREGLYVKIPESVGFEAAATLGAAIVTVGQGLYQSLGFPLPGEGGAEKQPVLIYGGSTATGAIAIQFAKLSGLEVITTCSPRNFDMVKSLGASAVFDYSAPDCGAKIREYTNNRLYHALDCISESTSPQICADALSTDTSAKKPAYSALLPAELPRADIGYRLTVGYTATNEAFEKGGIEQAASEEDHRFAMRFYKLSERLLAEGKFKPHQQDIRKGPLEKVLDGVDELRQGKVSAKKIVYRIADP